MKKYIDIGVNLTAKTFANDVGDVIKRAQQVGVDKMIITGTNIAHSVQAITLAKQYPSTCYATVGLHPHHAGDCSHSMMSEMLELLQNETVVAVGETGLDFNRNYATRSQQIKAFEAQLELAVATQKPIFLHQRDAHDDFIAIIKNVRNQLGKLVTHCFTGTLDELEDYNQLEMYIGVTGWICDDKRGQALRQCVKNIPHNKIMLETDAPYLLPRDLTHKPYQQNRNEPYYLPHIAKTVANYMVLGEQNLTDLAYENSLRFFSIKND